MICPACQSAGRYNQIANQDESWMADFASDSARNLHAACKGGCDCQHVVGMVINRGQGNQAG